MPPAPPASKLDDEGTKHVTSLLGSYYELKDALVATSAGKADHAAQELSAKADSLIAYIRTDSANGAELVPHLDTIKAEVKHITSIMDEGCENKRVYFDVISATMYTMLKKAGLKNARVYHQYCPMAFNDKGAYWLSKDEEIKNPYFGDKMLECGEITDTIN
jgi:Cu(I)/Ag(I) efflux system membrane fusion protein